MAERWSNLDWQMAFWKLRDYLRQLRQRSKRLKEYAGSEVDPQAMRYTGHELFELVRGAEAKLGEVEEAVTSLRRARVVLPSRIAREVDELIQGDEDVLGRILDLASESPDYAVLSEMLRYASREMEELGRELDYLLCYHLSELSWGVATRNAEIISWALRDILEVLDPSDRRKGQEARDLYGLCYLLLSLGEGRAFSGDGKIYFFSTAVAYVAESARYRDILGLLWELQGRTPGDPLVKSVRMRIENTESIPCFEREIVQILLRGLEKPLGKDKG